MSLLYSKYLYTILFCYYVIHLIVNVFIINYNILYNIL